MYHLYAILNMSFICLNEVALLILLVGGLDHLTYQHQICMMLYETTEGGVALRRYGSKHNVIPMIHCYCYRKQHMNTYI